MNKVLPRLHDASPLKEVSQQCIPVPLPEPRGPSRCCFARQGES